MAVHNDLGKKGEELAVAHLKEKGYLILARNYRHQRAEVDIIIQKEGILAAVEVKTRSTSHFGAPQEFVGRKQRQMLLRAIDHFVTDRQLEVEVRFDIIAIIRNKAGTQIEHLEDAYYPF